MERNDKGLQALKAACGRMILRRLLLFTQARALWTRRETVFNLKALMVVLYAGLIASAADAAGLTKGREIAPLTPEFKPGDYVWKPEISPAGPVVIIVSIPEQSMFVDRNGVRIGRSIFSLSGSIVYVFRDGV
jgi:hypothetical protein